MNARELLGFDPRELWPGLKVVDSSDDDVSVDAEPVVQVASDDRPSDDQSVVDVA